MPEAPLVQVCVVIGPPGCGKTRLMRQWARQSPPEQRWTLIQRGQVEPDGTLPDNKLSLTLAHDCACCNGRMVLQTHLARTLRLRRPDWLLIEADHSTHLPALLDWLGGPKWSGWLAAPKAVLIWPMWAPAPEGPWQELAAAADVVCIPDASDSPANGVANRLLALRQAGRPGQVRVNAKPSQISWALVENALGCAAGAL